MKLLKQIRENKYLARIVAVTSGSLFATAAGLLCYSYSLGEPLARRSYDLLFPWRTTLETSEVVLVYLDEFSAKRLNQPLDNIWNRSVHARLLDRLTEEKARLIFYDIVFDAPAIDPANDVHFAEAMQRHGRVVLGASYDLVQEAGGQVQQERISPPVRALRRAAAGWGVLAFRPVDPDYGVRQIYFGPSAVPSATWKAAELLGAPITQRPRESLDSCWINYYGPPDTFSSSSIANALEPDGLPPGYFANKIVLIGGRSSVGYVGAMRDEFTTPFSVRTRSCPGTEVHATILLNLLRGEWLTRLAPNLELSLVLLIGLGAGALGFLRPWFAALVAIFVGFAIVACACWLCWGHRIWFAWLIPAGLQLPVGFVWAVGAQYVLEAQRRNLLRRAFGFYLSPEMADRIADSDFDLTPGGKVVEATIIFTDLENFTAISEDLDPMETSQLLIAYFRQTTKCILEKQGTIIKYVGDAVMAAWGAPIDEPQHALRATEAACDLRCMTELEVRGKKLRTRIGVHSGKVLAGNLGSEYRFDYTMIGDTTNFASRLESLNKYLGTQALISDAVHAQLGDRFTTRLLGEFRVAGKTHSVVLHELICRCEHENGERQWIDVFERGLSCFRAREFQRAAELMNQTCKMRGGSDGPGEFYLERIAALEARGVDEKWDGVVALSEK